MKNVSGVVKNAIVLFPKTFYFYFCMGGSVSYKSVVNTELKFIH